MAGKQKKSIPGNQIQSGRSVCHWTQNREKIQKELSVRYKADSPSSSLLFVMILFPYQRFLVRCQGGEVSFPTGTEVDVPSPETTCERSGSTVIVRPHGTIITF